MRSPLRAASRRWSTWHASNRTILSGRKRSGGFHQRRMGDPVRNLAAFLCVSALFYRDRHEFCRVFAIAHDHLRQRLELPQAVAQGDGVHRQTDAGVSATDVRSARSLYPCVPVGRASRLPGPEEPSNCSRIPVRLCQSVWEHRCGWMTNTCAPARAICSWRWDPRADGGWSWSPTAAPSRTS